MGATKAGTWQFACCRFFLRTFPGAVEGKKEDKNGCGEGGITLPGGAVVVARPVTNAQIHSPRQVVPQEAPISITRQKLAAVLLLY